MNKEYIFKGTLDDEAVTVHVVNLRDFLLAGSTEEILAFDEQDNIVHTCKVDVQWEAVELT